MGAGDPWSSPRCARRHEHGRRVPLLQFLVKAHRVYVAILLGGGLLALAALNGLTFGWSDRLLNRVEYGIEVKRDAVRRDFFPRDPAKINVLFFGDSQLAAAILPAAFEEASGGRMRAANLALPSSPIGTM